MNLKDVQEIYGAGLISDDQRQKIIDHFHLDHPHNRFLVILLAIGGALVLTGIILVISANWDAIPGLAKIAVGALLMAGAHRVGWHFRGTNQTYPRLGGVFHFLGAGLFLANIALVGQVYHLSSRPPNAVLLWLAGIIPLVWILRSVSIHVLTLGGLLVWLAMEINAPGGWLHFASHASQLGIFTGVGALLYGCGLALKRATYQPLALPTQLFGMLTLHFSLWPVIVAGSDLASGPALACMAAPALVGLALIATETRRIPELTAQWRNTWLAVITGWLVIAALWMFLDFHSETFILLGHMSVGQAFAAILLVAGSLVQMRIAEELRAPWLVNIAILTTGYAIVVTFGMLIGSMMNTGLIFLVGGAGILGLGFLLEKKRRAVIERMKA
jgi:uncharacterized membrane protein